ncbi:respiratory-chain NADH dehydrogenase 51 Kd subunit [Mycobacterium xenopi 3993]|nr:respiratory-chain NADH dehydrogenase 51 Kd subunit [Mycobacterium xenopi 3993]
MLATPHVLIEGSIIAAYAIRASHAFIYVRGEVLPVIRRLHNAVAEAYAAGFLGTDILGSDYDLDLVVHAGAGAYICGEETALLDSLEGRRGQPRLRPPFPAEAACTGARPSSTMLKPLRRSLRSFSTASIGSGRWAARSRLASRCARCPGTSPAPASTRRRWASRCVNCSPTPAVCAPDTG